ncbi:SLC13 family permease [Fastidiosibacter lacustris]|uniref:SLC13 family permease n=1 Tax=Fastidiosibacter lacustris TaxID=2056695 RepID=UPI000E34D5BD|nr:DASS family sodium-coupled anion symporter [Fastidiosibacter lacustris]
MCEKELQLPTLPSIFLCVLASMVIYFVALFLPFGEFSASGKHAFAVFCVAVFLWIINIFPLAITGIIVLFLLPASGVIFAQDVYSYFGNSATFFVLGAFILASPVMRSGLSKRLAITIISKFGKGSKRLCMSIFGLSSTMAFFISEHAVVAMLLPIVLEIVTAANVNKKSRFAFAAYMAMAWGAMIGGTATLLGGARAPLALGILQDNFATNAKMAHVSHIGFFEWSLWVIPIVLVMLCLASICVLIIAHKSGANIELARQKLIAHKKEIGRVTKREVLTLMVVLFTIFLWIFYGTAWGLDWISFLGVILAFILRITNWKEIERDVQWGIIIMYGSAIALSVALRNTGAAHEMVQVIIDLGISSPLLIIVSLIVLVAILTEVMSNAAAVAILLPVGLALSLEYGIDPRVITVGIATGAGLTFLLPVSTPAMALVLHSDHVKIHAVMAWGIWLKISSILVIIVAIIFYWPLLGAHLLIQ